MLNGIDFGTEGNAPRYITSRLFGRRDFAERLGILFRFIVGGGAGPVL